MALRSWVANPTKFRAGGNGQDDWLGLPPYKWALSYIGFVGRLLAARLAGHTAPPCKSTVHSPQSTDHATGVLPLLPSCCTLHPPHTCAPGGPQGLYLYVFCMSKSSARWLVTRTTADAATCVFTAFPDSTSPSSLTSRVSRATKRLASGKAVAGTVEEFLWRNHSGIPHISRPGSAAGAACAHD